MFVAFLFTLCFLVFVFHFTLTKNRGKTRSPPGPFPYPILGNFPQLGRVLHISLTELSHSFDTGLYQLHLMGKRVIVLNNGDLAKSVLVTNGSKVGDRTSAHVIDVMTRNGSSIIFGKYGPTWKRQRKIVHSALRYFNTGILNIESVITKEIDVLIDGITSTNQKRFDPKLPITLCVMNVICSLTYGQRYDLDDKEFIQIVANAEALANIASPKNPLILLPWLRYFPLTSVKYMNAVIKERDELLQKKLNEHICTYKEGVIRDLTDCLLKNMSESSQNNMTKDHLEMAVSDVFLAGFETTTTTLRWILLYLILYPEVQARIHQEIDDVIASSQIPGVENAERLPYLQATIKEVMRISPVFPVIRRKATCDFKIQDCDVLQGTLVYVNVWAIHHDSSKWENPYEFRPARFLDNYDQNSCYFPFGAGVRVCVGSSLAKTELFLIVSRLLLHFKFVVPPGADRPDTEGVASTVYWPKPFEMLAIPRRDRK